jgi:hypothetical protein
MKNKNHRDTEDTEEVGFSLAGRPARLALLAWRAGGGQGKVPPPSAEAL